MMAVLSILMKYDGDFPPFFQILETRVGEFLLEFSWNSSYLGSIPREILFFRFECDRKKVFFKWRIKFKYNQHDDK
jgi:hypothetical protein